MVYIQPNLETFFIFGLEIYFGCLFNESLELNAADKTNQKLNSQSGSPKSLHSPKVTQIPNARRKRPR